MLVMNLNVKDFEVTNPNLRFNIIAGNSYDLKVVFDDLWDGVADIVCRVKDGVNAPVDVPFIKGQSVRIEVPVNAEKVGLGFYANGDIKLVTEVKEFDVRKSILSE